MAFRVQEIAEANHEMPCSLSYGTVDYSIGALHLVASGMQVLNLVGVVYFVPLSALWSQVTGISNHMILVLLAERTLGVRGLAKLQSLGLEPQRFGLCAPEKASGFSAGA